MYQVIVGKDTISCSSNLAMCQLCIIGNGTSDALIIRKGQILLRDRFVEEYYLHARLCRLDFHDSGLYDNSNVEESLLRHLHWCNKFRQFHFILPRRVARFRHLTE